MLSVDWISFLRLSEFIFRKIKMYKKESLNWEKKSQQNVKRVSMFGMKLPENCSVLKPGEKFFANFVLFIWIDKKNEKNLSSQSFVQLMFSFGAL